jgi:hypothetical protein
MSQWQTELYNEFQSKDPVRIAAALRKLREYLEDVRYEFQIPLPRPNLLLPFGPNVPQEVLEDLADILRHYRSFNAAVPHEQCRVLHL